MIFDKENSFCFNTSLIASAQGATVLGDVIDLFEGNSSLPNPVPPVGGPIANLHDLFAGNQPEVYAQMTTALAQAANTVALALTIADNTALTTNAATLYTTGNVAAAVLVLGYRLRVPVKFPPILGRQRYLGWLYTVTTTAVTAGAFTSGLVWNSHSSPGAFV